MPERRPVVIPQVHQALARPEIEELFIEAIWRVLPTTLTTAERTRECRRCLEHFRDLVRP